MPRQSRIVLKRLADLIARARNSEANQIGWAESADVVDRLLLAGFRFSSITQSRADDLVKQLIEVVDSATFDIIFDELDSSGALIDIKSLNITKHHARKLRKHLARFLIMQSCGKSIVSPINKLQAEYSGDVNPSNDYPDFASWANLTSLTRATRTSAMLQIQSAPKQFIEQELIPENGDLDFYPNELSKKKCIAAWDPVVARTLLIKGWHKSASDGLFRFETPAERHERVAHDVSVFFNAYDDIDASLV